MSSYRCYILDVEDKIASVDTVVAEDDADALNKAALKIRVSPKFPIIEAEACLAVSLVMTERGTQVPHTAVNEDVLNMGVRMFLKQVGITAQREIENAVREAHSKGEITSKEVLSARATITVGLTSLDLVVDGQIELNSPRPAGVGMKERSHPHQVIAGPPIETEADHFLRCPTCGTWIDCRSLDDLLDHEEWCTHRGITSPRPGKLIQ